MIERDHEVFRQSSVPNRRRTPGGPRARAERGAASVEYTLTTLAVVTALFMLPANGDGQSTVAMLLDALRQFQQNTTYLLSLP